MTLLALSSALVAVVFLVLVAVLAARIANTLEAIGSREPSVRGRTGAPPSLLGRIWFGVRAIEKQLSALPPQAARLNENLEQLAGGLEELKAALRGALEAVERQGR